MPPFPPVNFNHVQAGPAVMADPRPRAPKYLQLYYPGLSGKFAGEHQRLIAGVSASQQQLDRLNRELTRVYGHLDEQEAICFNMIDRLTYLEGRQEQEDRSRIRSRRRSRSRNLVTCATACQTDMVYQLPAAPPVALAPLDLSAGPKPSKSKEEGQSDPRAPASHSRASQPAIRHFGGQCPIPPPGGSTSSFRMTISSMEGHPLIFVFLCLIHCYGLCPD